MNVPLPTPNVNQQMQLPNYPKPYDSMPYLQPPGLANTTSQEQTPPELVQMYMQIYSKAQSLTTGFPGPMAPSNPTSSMSPDSGNSTASPASLTQDTHSLPNSAHISPQYPGNPGPSQYIGGFPPVAPPVMTQQHITSYGINDILNGTTSVQPLSTILEADEEPSSSQKFSAGSRRRRPAPYEKSPNGMMTPDAPFTMMDGVDTQMEDTKARNMCQVCGDNATGIHYGVLSCEGCKAFFRRSAPEKVHKSYICLAGDSCQFSFKNCIQNRNLRNQCKACRFKKCLRAGMRLENLRPKRSSKLQRQYMSPVKIQFSPRIEALLIAFETLMPPSKKITSKEEAETLIKQILMLVTGFSDFLPTSSEDLNKLIEKLMPGLLTIRAAFTLDNVPFFTGNAAVEELIEKLRSGIRNSVLHNEGLACLSGLFILRAVNKDFGEMYEELISGMSNHFAVTQSQDAETSERLITKLGLLI